MFATEAGGGKRKRRGKFYGPRVRSYGEVIPNYRSNGPLTGNNFAPSSYEIPNFTTVRPFAYTTSPKTGSKLGDDNLRNIQKSFLYGEKKNADFK